MITLSPKTPEEVVSVSFDYAGLLAAGETIQSASLSLSVLHGSDAAAASMLTATEVFSGAVVSRLVRNGVDATDYVVSCLATTNLGQVLQLSGILPVRVQT